MNPYRIPQQSKKYSNLEDEIAIEASQLIYRELLEKFGKPNQCNWNRDFIHYEFLLCENKMLSFLIQQNRSHNPLTNVFINLSILSLISASLIKNTEIHFINKNIIFDKNFCSHRYKVSDKFSLDLIKEIITNFLKGIK